MQTVTKKADGMVTVETPAALGEETPAQAARADRDYWTDRDWRGQPDDPSDHYDY